MRLTKCAAILGAVILMGLSSPAHSQTPDHKKADDTSGRPDSVRIEIRNISNTHWQAVVSLTNDENLAAMTLPLRWSPRHGFFRLDSASYADTRTHYFAVKTFWPDTTKETILIGLISDLGSGLPPLEPGSGPIANLYFTMLKSTTKPLTIDTVFIGPHNVLQLVTPDVQSLYPAFEVRSSKTVPK